MYYYYNELEYGTESMTIIDEKTLIDAENGKNYLDHRNYSFLCEANSPQEATKYYWDVEFQEYVSGQTMERYHP